MPFNLYKDSSNIHNKGIFAGEAIPKDSFIIEYTGQHITPLAAEVRERIYAEKCVTYLFNLDDKRVIDGGVGGNLSAFINHSCDPNCKVIVKDRKALIYSKKDIKKDEELTFDYNFSSNAFKEICNCGSQKCRGFINRA